MHGMLSASDISSMSPDNDELIQIPVHEFKMALPVILREAQSRLTEPQDRGAAEA